MIGKLRRIPLRQVWPHEAYDFTTWLQNNLNVLNNVTNLTLTNAEREKAVGTFNVDLVAEDQFGNTIIIENQLDKSDHDHLGKLLTYLIGVEAQTAIWIVANPRPEHVSVINWLNETSAASFYLLKVEAVQINDSLPAPLLTLIVGPSEEARAVGHTKKELAERHYFRRDFWQSLIERARQRTRLHANISPSPDNWIATSAGRSGLTYVYSVLKHAARVELAIDTGDNDENKRLFAKLYANQTAIETAFTADLEWDSVEGRRACYLRKRFTKGGYRDKEQWPEIQDEMIETMIKLEQALRLFIQKL